jgi:hypothetical protein
MFERQVIMRTRRYAAPEADTTQQMFPAREAMAEPPTADAAARRLARSTSAASRFIRQRSKSGP